MPVYNTEKYLAEAVESIRNQTFCDFEFIILDDGSTDRSLDILRRFAKQDSRIVVHSRENRGLVATRNQLMQLARGEWLVWADSDDISYPFRIEKLIEVMKSGRELVWVGSAYRLVDPSGWPIRVMDNPDSLNKFGAGAALFLKSVAVQVGGFQDEFLVGEDTNLGLRMQKHGKVYYCKQPLLDYRQYFESVCNSMRLAVDHYTCLATQRAGEYLAQKTESMRSSEKEHEPIFETDQRPEPAWKTHLRWAWWALMDGNVWTARKHSFYATIKNPKSTDSWKGLFCAMRGY